MQGPLDRQRSSADRNPTQFFAANSVFEVETNRRIDVFGNIGNERG
ncbi:hypothetical protein [Sphingomonas sp.]|nr:hypothetical protein [Sphingomonas sp.]MBA3512334.1 hypothetical protein [Sphingomonas sp.]